MNNKTNFIFGILLTSLLAACGDEPKPGINPNDPRAGIYGAGYGGCTVPPGIKDKTVVGSLGNGATITLDIYSQPAGTIAAIGQIDIPNVGGLYLDGTMGQPFHSCISSNGSVGTINRSSTYQNIEISLQGNGVYVSFGSQYGVETYITGDALEGSAYIEAPALGRQPWVFPMARP